MKDLIVHNTPKSPISEAYRGIRTNLLFANVDKNVKSILITSATSGEGKTTTLCNLAMSLADLGHKVIVLDCDLRKPRIHKFLEISNQVGLTDVLLGETGYTQFLHRGIHENLSVLTSGKIPRNPSELLNSNAMKQFLESLKSDYDYIIIDTPPVLPVTDTVIMSTYIDRVILVCASGVVDVDHAKKAKDTLEKVGAQIMGVVINKFPIKGKKYQYYYYYSEESEA